jgi:hypothetical protein
MMKKKITVISCLIFVAAMMMFAQPAMAGKWAETPSGLDLQILAASIVEGSTVENFLLVILGYNFDNGDVPIVKVADTPGVLVDMLDIGLHQGKTLWALVVECTSPFPDLPGILPLPNFLLTVQTGPSVHQFDTFNFLVPFYLNLNLGDFDSSLLQ